MGKEAVEHNLQAITPFIEECRTGQVENNGYNLWVHAHVIQKHGGSLDSVGITNDQVRGYLVQDLRSRIDAIDQGTADVGTALFSLDLIGGYFLPGDPDYPPIEEGIFEQLGLTIDEFKNLEHKVNVRAAREELERCRTEGVAPSFFGLQDRLLSGEATLEEIGATQEEMSIYMQDYKNRFPSLGSTNITS